jgi:hypothetical protein
MTDGERDRRARSASGLDAAILDDCTAGARFLWGARDLP